MSVSPSQRSAATPGRAKSAAGRAVVRRAGDAIAARLVAFSGWSAILVLAAIAIFLGVNAYKALADLGFFRMVAGTAWYPTGTPARFGFLPYVVASLRVTGVALAIAVPVGIAAAVFVSEFADERVRTVAKSVIEFMAAVPSVVYGLVGVSVVGPALKSAFGLPSALTALSAGVVLGFMALPTIVTISEDALRAVPKDLRQGSLALGNTHWQTARKVVVPAASSGIFAAVMLGLGRAIGETMVVLMVAGNSMELTWSLTTSARPLTSVIAGEMGEVVQGGLHYSALFVIGLTLFVVTFLVNLAADLVLERQRQRWGR